MHRKVSRKRTMRRKMKGGYYGMSGSIAPGAPLWGRASEMDSSAGRGGNTQLGGRRRKMKKSTKRHRKIKGGGSFGGVSASFQGTGVKGIANYNPVSVRTSPGTAAGGSFNNFGAQPGSGFSSFLKSA
jgi:hypothetical protein